MTIYQEEMQRKAQHYGCTTEYGEEDRLLYIGYKDVYLAGITAEGYLHYTSKDLTVPEAKEIFARLTDDAEIVREYVGLYESAPQMKPKDVQNYRKFSEYGDVVFAGMYSEKHGFMFCSWRQSDGGKSNPPIVSRETYKTAQELNLGVLQTLKVHIGMALETELTEDNSMDLQIRIAEIDAEFKAMLAKISTETVDAFDEEKAKRLMDEKVALQQQLADIQNGQLKREQTQSRLDDIYTILDGLKNRPMEYDEQIVRQLLECITVDSKEQITVIFVGGLKVVQPLID